MTMLEPLSDTPYFAVYSKDRCPICSSIKRKIGRTQANMVEVNIEHLGDDETTDNVRDMLVTTFNAQQMPIVVIYNVFDEGPITFSGAAFDQLRVSLKKYIEKSSTIPDPQWTAHQDELNEQFATNTRSCKVDSTTLPYHMSSDGQLSVVF